MHEIRRGHFQGACRGRPREDRPRGRIPKLRIGGRPPADQIGQDREEEHRRYGCRKACRGEKVVIQ